MNDFELTLLWCLAGQPVVCFLLVVFRKHLDVLFTKCLDRRRSELITAQGVFVWCAYINLLVGFSFGLYGLIDRIVKGETEGFQVECLYLFLFTFPGAVLLSVVGFIPAMAGMLLGKLFSWLRERVAGAKPSEPQ